MEGSSRLVIHVVNWSNSMISLSFSWDHLIKRMWDSTPTFDQTKQEVLAKSTENQRKVQSKQRKLWRSQDKSQWNMSNFLEKSIYRSLKY